jgi:medium-chain acyl-[acyl-carrier-protein] hydrolase
MAPLLAALERELVLLLDRPYSFFGHSMGALLAYELIHRLQANGHRQPLHLFVSGRPAPQCTATKTRIHELPLEEFIETLRNYYGTPEIIFRNPDLQDLVLAALQADLELLETWNYAPHERLTLPISAYGGESDRGVPREHLEAWREQSTGPFEMHFLPGDHFFLHSAQADLLNLLSRKLLA